MSAYKDLQLSQPHSQSPNHHIIHSLSFFKDVQTPSSQPPDNSLISDNSILSPTSKRHEQLPSSSSISIGFCDSINPPLASTPILGRDEGTSNHLFHGYQRDGNSGNPPKPEFPGATHIGGYESSYGFFCESTMGNKCTRPSSTSSNSCLHPNNADFVEPPSPSQSISKLEQPRSNPFLHSARAHSQQPTDLSLDASPDSTTNFPHTSPREPIHSNSSRSRRGKSPSTWKDKFVHRNIKLQKCSPYDFSKRRGQKVHTQLSTQSNEVLF